MTHHTHTEEVRTPLRKILKKVIIPTEEVFVGETDTRVDEYRQTVLDNLPTVEAEIVGLIDGMKKRFGFLPRDIDEQVKKDVELSAESYNQALEDLKAKLTQHD